MALYKQPYGSALQQETDDGFLERWRNKRAAKKTSKLTGVDYTKQSEEEKIDIVNKVSDSERKGTIKENASISFETTTNASMSTEAKKIVDAAGTSGHSGFVESFNPNSGNHDSFMRIVRQGNNSTPSYLDITPQSSIDQSNAVEGRVGAYTGNTKNIKLNTGTLGVTNENSFLNRFSAQARLQYGDAVFRNPATYESSIGGVGIGPAVNNTQVKYRTSGGGFSEIGKGFNFDAGVKLSNPHVSVGGGIGLNNMNPVGSRTTAYVEGGLNADLYNNNSRLRNNFYDAKKLNVRVPIEINAKAVTGMAVQNKENASYKLPLNSLRRDGGFSGKASVMVENAVKGNKFELGFKKNYGDSKPTGFFSISHIIGKNKNK